MDYFQGLMTSLAFVQESCGLVTVGLKFENDLRWQGFFFAQVTVTGIEAPLMIRRNHMVEAKRRS